MGGSGLALGQGTGMGRWTNGKTDEVAAAAQNRAAGALSSARRTILRFAGDQSGNYAIIGALLSPVLIGAAGLAVEGGLWVNQHQTMQGAADSAALSAAAQYGLNVNANLNDQAASVIATYGYVANGEITTITVNRPARSGNYTSNQKSVEVLITHKQDRLLSSIYNSQPVTITGRAVALPGSNGTGCVLSLNATASGGISSKGNSAVGLTQCSIYDNSSNTSALVNGGTASISAESVNVVGDISGGSGITTTNGINKGVSPLSDPYANVAMPTVGACDYNNKTYKTTVTIDPGVYCNGIQLNAGAVVTMNPGVYIIDRGTLQIAGGATLQGTGVTIFFTSSTGANYADATINGGATVAITAPTTGPLAGIAMFGDRNMPVGTTFKFNGGTNQVLGGAVYIPHGSIEYAGGATNNVHCTQLIGDTISFVGNATLANDCSAYGTRPIGTSQASLVE
jgi:Flp pilus assembly protein TadG